MFIRSVIDYLSPALIQLPKSALDSLDKFQNRVMRFILGCPSSTRIVNMQAELKLQSLADRIHSNVLYLTVKCPHTPYLAPHYTHVVRTALGPNSRLPQIQPGGRNLIKHVCSLLNRLNITVVKDDDGRGAPPWSTTLPDVLYTPTSKMETPA